MKSRLVLKGAFAAARVQMRWVVADRIKAKWIRETMLARIDAMRLTEEITHGDLVVATDSATAVGASTARTWPKLHHLALGTDQAVVKEVLALLPPE